MKLPPAAKGLAAVYCRISNDPEGRALGVERQEEDCRRLAARLGLDVFRVFVDNDISASSRGRKRRPAWDAMLGGAERGAFGSILFYSTSRLTRRPMDYEPLIPLAQAGVRFQSVVSGDLDLTTADGLLMARMMASVDEAEANRIAERVKRAAQQRAEKGLWHGGQAPIHGYAVTREETGYVNPKTGEMRYRVTDVQLDPVYAPLMREGARRLLAGEALYSICSDWNNRNITTRDGGRWISATLRRILLSPTAIGKRRVGDKLYDTGWPELLDRQTWDRLRTLFADPDRRYPPVGGSYAGKHALGGGVTVCDACGKKLVSQLHRGKPRLLCSTFVTGGCGKVVILYEPYERFVLDMVLARLDSPEWHEELTQQVDASDAAEEALRDELADLARQRARVGDAVVIGAYSRAEGEKKVQELNDRRHEVERELQKLTQDLVLDDVHSAVDALRLWAEADTQRRRRFILSLVTEVRVARWPAGRASNLTPRRNETTEEHAARLEAHNRAMLRERVTIRWRR